MGKRILILVGVLVVGYVLYAGYVHWRDTHSDSGDIHADSASDSTENITTPSPAPRPAPAAQPATVQAATTSTVSAPLSDSISPNPTNGVAFAGSGKFQVYRQGNLTWRVDTESGRACIIFATMEEWRKPIVYSHGCNNS